MRCSDGAHRGSRALRIADLGTGSGALLLALLSELPNAFGIGTDISPAALGCARDNAAALGLATATSFVACDYGAALQGPIDILVSNPPYVARGEIAGLQPEVRDFDPLRALDGGPRRSRRLSRNRRSMRGACSRRMASWRWSSARDQAQRGDGAFCRRGACAIGPPRHDLAGIARALVLRPAAMTPPHSRCEKKHLDCGSRPTRFWPGIDPRLLSADSEPRSRTAESRRCGRSERRTPDDPADGSPNRDEMLHRFGADPRARRTCA